MLDWLDIRGGEEGNAFSKDYLDLELGEDAEVSFNSLDFEEGDSSESGGEGSSLRKPSKGKRKRDSRGDANANDSRKKHDQHNTELIQSGLESIKEAVYQMIAAFNKSSEADGGLVQAILDAGEQVDKLEQKVNNLEADVDASAGALERAKEQFEIAKDDYENRKAKRAEAMKR